MGGITYFHWIRHGPKRKRRLQQYAVAAGASLPSCYLAMIGGYILRSLCLAAIEWLHKETHRLVGGFMNCPVEMGSGAIIYIQSPIQIGSGI
jgi:hypothetical protein